MTDQVGISPLMDLLVEINEHRKGLTEMSVGDQRRCFNEGIKNYGDKGKEIHDKFNNELLSKCGGAGELENLAKGLTFPVEGKKLEDINKIFEKIDSELTQDPRWESFWKKQQEQSNGKISDEELEKIKATILNGFRFKVIQMVGFNVVKTNPKVLNNYSSLMQALNGARAKQGTGVIDSSISISEAVAVHVSQTEFANKISYQDYLSHAEGKMDSMPNDKKIAPIFGQEIAKKAFSEAMAEKHEDVDFIHASLAQAIKNKNQTDIEKLDGELVRLTKYALTAADVLTNPIYFETDVYKTLAERSDKEFHIAENVEFAKFYHDFKADKLVLKTDDEIKTMVKEFLEGTGEAFTAGSKSEINISDIDKRAIESALLEVNTQGKLDRENLKKALDPAYTQVKTMLTGDVNLKSLEMKTVLTFEKPKIVDPSIQVANQRTGIQSEPSESLSLIQRLSNRLPREPSPQVRGIGKAISAFFKNGFSIKAAREAYAQTVAPQVPIPRQRREAIGEENGAIEKVRASTPKQETIDPGLQNTFSHLLGSAKNGSDVEKGIDFRSGPPYTPTIDSEKPTQDNPDKLKSNLFHFLNDFQIKGKELDNLQRQTGHAATQIASGAEPKGVIQSLERAIQSIKEEADLKDPNSVESLANLEKRLGQFKDRSEKLDTVPTEPKQTSTPSVSKRSI